MNQRNAGARLVLAPEADDRRVLDDRTIARHDGVAEPARGLVLLRERRFGISPWMLELAERLRAKLGVVRVDGGDGLRFGRAPGAKPTFDPSPGGSLGFHPATLTKPAP